MDLYSLLLTARRYRQLIWCLTLAVTIVLGIGALRVRVETGILDWLPARHPNVQAFGTLFEKLEGAVHQELLWLELDPDKAGPKGVRSIIDPGSFLAQEELVNFLRQRVPGIRGEFGLLSLLRVANSIGTEVGDTVAPLPAPPRIRLLWSAVAGASSDLVNSLVSNDPATPGTILALVLDAPPLSEAGRQIASNIDAALAAYRDAPDIQHDIFVDRYLVPAGLSSGTAEMDRSLRDDLLWLVPAASIILLIVLRLALGSWTSLALVASQLALGTLWTIGFMGWFGTPLNVITFALIPLVLGCGIDYAILISLDALDRRTEGQSAEEAIRSVKRSSVVAILLTTMTTTAGLLALVMSDSMGMVALGIHGALGMLSVGFLSTLVLPGLLVRLPPGRRSRVGPVIAPVATSFARNRSVVLLVTGVATVAAVVLVQKPVFLLDVVEGNYPSESPIATSVARMREKCGGSFPEIVIVRGDLSSPESWSELVRMQKSLAASAHLGERFRVVGAADILGTYALFRDRNLVQTVAALATNGGNVTSFLPTTTAELQETARSMYADPAWEPIVSLFVDPKLEIATILLLGGDAGTDMQSVRDTWNELDAALGTGGGPLDASFLGYRTMAYLFATHSEYWIRVTLFVSLAVVLTLAIAFLRDMRAVLVIVVLLVLSSLWWLALLQLSDIHVSIFLLFPLVFTICIGSDYGLHMLCRLRADRRDHASNDADLSPLDWTHSAWSSTGRAIAIAALTDGVIFWLFAQMDLVSASQIMQAVALAVAAVFGCTILVVPALAFSKEELRRRDRP
jgi:predicted RND superfamily exporter protein